MDFQAVTEFQQELVRTLLSAAPEGWDRLDCEVVVVGGYGVHDAQAVSVGGRERIGASMAGSHGMDLQEAMYDAEKGTWLSMTCRVEPSREYHFTFNYDQPVEFDEHEPVLDESWEREFRRHPRPWALIPDWTPIKQKYSEAQWIAEVERYQREGRH